jgi:hypothetical protein
VMGIVFLFAAFIFESSFGIKGCKKNRKFFAASCCLIKMV